MRSPRIRKHYYDLSDPEDFEDAEERVKSLRQLADDADRVWKENGFTHILVNQLCLKTRYEKQGELLYIEWRTRHISRRGT